MLRKQRRKRDIKVSNEEALADLKHNSDLSFKQNSKNSNFVISNPTEYFNEQLRRLNLDPTQAARIWRQVMLFRALFHDAGNAIFVDTFSFKKVNAFMNEVAEGELYQLPTEFHLGNEEDLRKFEAYLTSISPQQQNSLHLPSKFKSVEEIKKSTPELVQKKYTIEVAQADSKQFEGRVSLKETWSWEADEGNWKELKEEFPELGTKSSNTREARIALLDG